MGCLPDLPPHRLPIFISILKIIGQEVTQLSLEERPPVLNGLRSGLWLRQFSTTWKPCLAIHSCVCGSIARCCAVLLHDGIDKDLALVKTFKATRLVVGDY